MYRTLFISLLSIERSLRLSVMIADFKTPSAIYSSHYLLLTILLHGQDHVKFAVGTL